MKQIELIEKINGLTSRGKALFLAGLVLLGSSAYVKTANAENKDMIPTDYFSGFTFERLPIETIFDMTSEDSQRIIVPNNIILVVINDKILDKEFYVPTTTKVLSIIKDEQKNTDKNKILLQEGNGILLSELKKYVTDKNLKN